MKHSWLIVFGLVLAFSGFILGQFAADQAPVLGDPYHTRLLTHLAQNELLERSVDVGKVEYSVPEGAGGQSPGYGTLYISNGYNSPTGLDSLTVTTDLGTGKHVVEYQGTSGRVKEVLQRFDPDELRADPGVVRLIILKNAYSDYDWWQRLAQSHTAVAEFYFGTAYYAVRMAAGAIQEPSSRLLLRYHVPTALGLVLTLYGIWAGQKLRAARVAQYFALVVAAAALVVNWVTSTVLVWDLVGFYGLLGFAVSFAVAVAYFNAREN